MSGAYDAVIIGAGQAGPPLANRLSRFGMRVAVIERKLFGGTCVNTGCMPTKTLIASAYVAHSARRASNCGVVINEPWRSISPESRLVRIRCRGMPGLALKLCCTA
jgi:pyruvate/2-oxoglutarate dehydrogenase complex dihydrolipoamide dehydrogenase (E3) component